MTSSEFAPVTPGEMLKEEFLASYGLSQNALAKAIGISPNRIAEIANNRRRITADTALRLALYFGNSPEFWLNLQTYYCRESFELRVKPFELNAGVRGCEMPIGFGVMGVAISLPCGDFAGQDLLVGDAAIQTLG
jgi:addiction module HigA family antidote